MIEPSEKARDLVMVQYRLINNDVGIVTNSSDWEKAKLCASVVAIEIIKEFSEYSETLKDCSYWIKVNEEIKKL